MLVSSASRHLGRGGLRLRPGPAGVPWVLLFYATQKSVPHLLSSMCFEFKQPPTILEQPTQVRRLAGKDLKALANYIKSDDCQNVFLMVVMRSRFIAL